MIFVLLLSLFCANIASAANHSRHPQSHSIRNMLAIPEELTLDLKNSDLRGKDRTEIIKEIKTSNPSKSMDVASALVFDGSTVDDVAMKSIASIVKSMQRLQEVSMVRVEGISRGGVKLFVKGLKEKKMMMGYPLSRVNVTCSNVDSDISSVQKLLSLREQFPNVRISYETICIFPTPEDFANRPIWGKGIGFKQ